MVVRDETWRYVVTRERGQLFVNGKRIASVLTEAYKRKDREMTANIMKVLKEFLIAEKLLRELGSG
jgi:hypothetical protein